MSIEEAIQMLEKMKKNGVKNLVVATWDAKCFDMEDGEEWGAIAETLEHKIDWSHAYDQMQWVIDNVEEE